MGDEAGKLLDTAEEINGIKLITKEFDNISVNDLRSLSDDIKAEKQGRVHGICFQRRQQGHFPCFTDR